MSNYNRKKLIFKGHNGQTIILDDFVDDTKEYNLYWGGLCPSCRKRYKDILGDRIEEFGCGTCSVEGCWNAAENYVNFIKEEVKIINVYHKRKVASSLELRG